MGLTKRSNGSSDTLPKHRGRHKTWRIRHEEFVSRVHYFSREKNRERDDRAAGEFKSVVGKSLLELNVMV